MDFSQENNVYIYNKYNSDNEQNLDISNELIELYRLKITENTFKDAYQYGLEMSGSPYQKFIDEIPKEFASLYFNKLFIVNQTLSYYTKEIHGMFEDINSSCDIDKFFFMNVKTGINFKKLECIENKVAFNKVPYENIRYNDESPIIKRGDLDMKVDMKFKSKKIVYVINLSDIIYVNNNVYKKIIKALKENLQYKYLLIIDNIYTQYTEKFSQDIKNQQSFYKILPLINFSLMRIYNKQMFNINNIYEKRYFHLVNNLYPFNNFQHQLLFERNDTEKINTFQIPVLNKISNIIKSSIEFIDHIKNLDIYTDFHLKNTCFIINQLITNIDYIIKTKFTFPIIYVFTTINDKNIKLYLQTLLFIKLYKDSIFKEKNCEFINKITIYTDFTVKYSIVNQISELILHINNQLGLKKIYLDFLSKRCSMCIINEGKLKCKCGKLYCSKECQKIDWRKEIFNHKEQCCKCIKCSNKKFDVKCKCERKYCSKECLDLDLIESPREHYKSCFESV